MHTYGFKLGGHMAAFFKLLIRQKCTQRKFHNACLDEIEARYLNGHNGRTKTKTYYKFPLEFQAESRYSH
jgi:hypothetical protein